MTCVGSALGLIGRQTCSVILNSIGRFNRLGINRLSLDSRRLEGKKIISTLLSLNATELI